MGDVWIAMAVTAFAGLATGIGSIIAFTAKRTNYRFLSVATGFSAGVMIYVSFLEILPEGSAFLCDKYGDYWGKWIGAASFFAGMFFIGIIDNLVPAAENPHEARPEVETMPLRDTSAPLPDLDMAAPLAAPTEQGGLFDHGRHHAKLMRMGLFTALAIGIHNFPEGLATFLVVLQNPGVGLAIAGAIALHNIPEGISVSVPIFYATGNRKKAFTWSVLSGLAEPVGAGFAYLVFVLLTGGSAGPFPLQVIGVLLGVVAGIMVYISLDEMLPTSRAYGKGHDSLIGLITGMAVMALSLLLMK